MPTRIIRDGILSSERVNQLSERAELFYRRLMSVVDDHGRFPANPQLLRASCYPLKLDIVKEDSIKKHLAEAEGAGLVVLYTVAGKAYLQMQDFGQRVQSKSKWPDPVGSLDSTVNHGEPPEKTALVGDVVGVEDELEAVGAEPSAQPPAITLPLNTGAEHPITEAQVTEYRDLYPATDVMSELRKMRGWLLANPANRKTARGIAAFVARWLGKEQDKGRANGGSPGVTVPPRNTGGVSPPKVETPASKIQEAKDAAARFVELGAWTPEQAQQHIAEVRAKHG